MRSCPTILLILALFGLAACSSEQEQEAPTLRLATTTSTRDSGLLDVLVPAFEKEAQCRVDVVAVGTGAALKLGENGDADVVLVHSKKAEEAFLAAGHSHRREEFMENYFVILGPKDDPAMIRGLAPDAAFKRLAEAEAAFISRGDDSGTHKREKQIRAGAALERGWPGLIESGQGMGATLVMADEKNAYVLSDSGTWSQAAAKMRLVPLVEHHDLLRNPYSVMPVAIDKHPEAKGALAEKFADFLISRRAQELIRDYQIEGQALFTPTRLAEKAGDGN